MNTKVTEFNEINYLQRVVIHLYDLLDDIDTANDMAKNNNEAYRNIVSRIQQRKNDSGVSSPDGYGLCIEKKEFNIKE